ncbi:unnamed protein product [Penicillium salamii]|nr:unnamed protein product [Penicillium salamii]CAG8390926.1 unnamed protein product [Penicillium salamii]
MTTDDSAPSYPSPQRSSGALDGFKYVESTPALGREYTDLQLSSIVDNDEAIRDLAITASERGVILFNDQDITPTQLKGLVVKLGKLTGNPPEAGLYRQPFTLQNNSHLDIPGTQKKTLGDALPTATRKFASVAWHTKSPPTGGDTLFVSSYGLYKRLSEPWQRFADSLTATHFAKDYLDFAEKGIILDEELQRGHPENVGIDFKASHPVVRTNPVTGWKGLYGVGYGLNSGSFDNMIEHESNLLKEYFLRMITDSSDLQVRKRWNDNGIAIWDNRAVHHNPTFDVIDGERLTFRITAVGEKPYFDPNSTSRAEYLQKNS